MRTRIFFAGFGLLAALAVADVATGWERLPFLALPILIVAGVAVLVLGGGSRAGRPLWLAFSGLAVAALAVHLGFSAYANYEVDRWDRLGPRRAAHALASAASTFDHLLRDASGTARNLADSRGLQAALDSGDRARAFTELARAGAGAGRQRIGSKGAPYGVAVWSPDGALYAWTGDLPNSFLVTNGLPSARPLGLETSTAYHWLEASAPIGTAPAEGGAGYRLTTFTAIEARYPGVIPGTSGHTLEEDLSRQIGHEVDLEFGPGTPAAPASQPGQLWQARDLSLPGGGIIGALSVRQRTAADERALLVRRGLPLAAILVLVLTLASAVVLARYAVGPRFSRFSPSSLPLFLAVVWVSRLVLALLRDPLGLGRLRAFSPVDYATQFPVGILRSPADLALTGAALALSLSVVMMARARSRRAAGASGPGISGPAGYLAVGLAAGLGAVGIVIGMHLALRRILVDSSVNVFSVSPFSLGASAVLMKIGLFGLTAGFLLAGAALVAWQIEAFARIWLGRTHPRRAWRNACALAAATVGALAAAAVLGGAGTTIVVPAAVTFIAGVASHAAFTRRLAPHFVPAVMTVALAIALVQFPYGLGDLYAKQREAIEAAAARVASRTDEWKASVLDEALTQIAGDQGVEAALAGLAEGQSRRLDSEALRLWAQSILSSAHLSCGVHILDRANREVGRFSLEDIGDLAEIEGPLRAARFAEGPTSFVTRGTFGGRDTDLYVGVVPISPGGANVGSVVISIPTFYNDLEWIAGLRPTFFEAIGSPSGSDVLFGADYSASLVSVGRVTATTAADLSVGTRIGGLAEPAPGAPAEWTRGTAAGRRHAFLPVAFGSPGEVLVFSYRPLSASEQGVYLMSVVLASLVVALLVIIVAGGIKGARHLFHRARGLPISRFRWSFATKLALAFLAVAIVPALILGAASREFLQARLREAMDSKAEEGLNLSKLALQRLVEGEAARLARNPILMDELRVEPSLLGVLVSGDVSAAVADSSGRLLASFGLIALPSDLVARVTREGRPLDSFLSDGGLEAISAVPVRDVVRPDVIAGSVLVSRRLDDALALRLASDLGRDITFYGPDRVEASSKQELFVAEMMPSTIAPDAYADCFLSGRETHFTWSRVGNVEVVIGYSPLRDFDGRPMGAISVPLVFRKDAVGRRMEWTSTAISYLVAIVIATSFLLGLVLARRMARPIRELIQGTRRVGSSRFGFTIPRTSDDEIGDLVTSFNEMTAAVERNRAELMERKRYIETLIGNVGAGIIFIDWRGQIYTVNGAAEKLLGVKAASLIGRKAGALLQRIGAGSLASVLDDVERGVTTGPREILLPREKGGFATVRAVATRVAGPRGRVSKVMVFEDMTDLIRSQKLVAWGEMARQVAHEIKNPLTPMKLSAQQVLQAHRDRAPDFDRILEESVATIIDQIESLRKITVEFSQFARMPERKPEAVAVNQLIEECLGQYERTLGGAVRIEKALDASNPVVRVDRDEVKRVFLNLIENAVQAMPDGGRLEVRSRVVSGSRRPGGAQPGNAAGGRTGSRAGYRSSATSRASYMPQLVNFVEVGFTDTGVGISPANSQKLFEPNFSTKTQGSGLGLAISKGIIDAYGGEILIESTEGVGTSVKARFPAEARPTGRARPRRRGSRRHRRPRRG